MEPSDRRMELGKRLVLVRKDFLKLSQEQLAERLTGLGVANSSFASVRRYETGEREPGVEYVAAVAQLADIPVWWFFSSKPGGPPPGLGYDATPPNVEPTGRDPFDFDDGGHLVVRGGGEIEYDPRPDPEGTPAERLMAFLGVRVGIRRLAGELTGKDLVATAYTLARAERFSAEDFKKLDAFRDAILAEERRGGG